MKTTCTAIAIALALLALHVVAHEAAAAARDRESHVAALCHGTPRYRVAKRQDVSRLVRRAADVQYHASTLPEAPSFARPDAYCLVEPLPPRAPRVAAVAPRVSTRAPPAR